MKKHSKFIFLKTDHAQIRQQQRSIKEHLVQQAQDYGTPYYVGDGRMAFVLGKKAAKMALKLGVVLGAEKFIAVIVSDTGWKITAMHVVRSIPPHWRPAA